MELSARHAPRGNYLRYQFDTAAQVLRHCRLVDGRVLLFFPDPYPRLAVRSRALIEISLAAGQQISLPAQVTARDENAGGGTWLAMRALAIVTGLQVAAITPRRRERRLAFDQLAWVEHGGGPVLACPVLDLSRSGARLWGVPGGIPAPEQDLRVRMNGAPTLRARIAWAHGREVGVQFAGDSSPSAERLYQRVEHLWSSARLVSHDPGCRCAIGGIATDPPVPSRAEQHS
jgi:hypothetical protein